MQPVSPFPHRKDAAAEALRTPPHSLEAEQSVLGGLMLDNATWDQVADRLDENDFYRNDHRLLFRAIRRLAESGKPFDLLTVAEWLEDNDQNPEAASVAAFLSTIGDENPDDAEALYDYISGNHDEAPERDFDTEYVTQPEDAYKTADLLRTTPRSLTPDLRAANKAQTTNEEES